MVTAGLTWQPDTGPIRYTSDSSVRPKASAVVTTPAATLAPSNLKPNMRVATPTAKNTRIAVPRNSAANFRIISAPPVAREHRSQSCSCYHSYDVTACLVSVTDPPRPGLRTDGP